MKKFLLVALCSLGLLLSCSDEDVPDYANDLSGTYKGNITINIPEAGEVSEVQKITLDYISHNKVVVSLNNFSFPIGGQVVNLGKIEVRDVSIQNTAGKLLYIVPTTANVEVNSIGTVKVTVSGTIVGKKIDLNIEVADTPVGTVDVKFTGDRMDADNEKTDALITSFIFNEDIVSIQPVINGTDILFYVADTFKTADLATLAPIIKISDGATVSPASGEAQDFSGAAVKYTVTAQDGMNKTVYTVLYATGKYNFEKWMDVSYTEFNNTVNCQEAFGWASLNPNLPLIKAFLSSFGENFIVSATSDAKGGEKAAKIETFNTSGSLFSVLPYITSGYLSLGDFKLNPTNDPASLIYGIPYSKKPKKFTGWYKYTPGKTYYVANTNNPSKATADNTTADSCSIIAVLYEVENMQNDFIPILDLYTSDKIVMKAELKDGSEKKSWTEFQLDFVTVSGKTYNPSKLYKLAIVCSSSRNGDKFCGATGSILIVDDFEIIAE